jgi:type I restriction enzyme M protein
MLTLASTATRPQAGSCLKMADERCRPPCNQPSPIPAVYAWPALRALDREALFDHYRHTLEELSKLPGTLGLIFAGAAIA